MTSELPPSNPGTEAGRRSEGVSDAVETKRRGLPLRPSAVAQPALSLGFWAAVLAITFTVLFVVLAITFPSGEWRGIEDYARDFDSLQMFQLIPVLLLAPTVVALITSIHTVAADSRKVFSMTAVTFSGIYAAIVGTNYMLQLFVVRLNVVNNDLEGLSLLAMGNPHSVFVALETIGYGFFGLVMLSAAMVFGGGRLERWIRSVLVVSGVTGIVGAVAAPLSQDLLTLIGFSLSLMAFLVAAVLVGLFFRRLRSGISRASTP